MEFYNDNIYHCKYIIYIIYMGLHLVSGENQAHNFGLEIVNICSYTDTSSICTKAAEDSQMPGSRHSFPSKDSIFCFRE